MRLVGGAPWFPSSLVLFSWTWGWVSLGSPVVLCCVGMATSHLASSYGWVCVWSISTVVLLGPLVSLLPCPSFVGLGVGFPRGSLVVFGMATSYPASFYGRVCVCVDHLKRCKTCFAAGGASSLFSLAPTKTLNTAGDITTDHRDVPANFGDIYMVINKCLVLSWFSCWKSCCFQYSWNLNFHDEALRCLSSCQSV